MQFDQFLQEGAVFVPRDLFAGIEQGAGGMQAVQGAVDAGLKARRAFLGQEFETLGEAFPFLGVSQSVAAALSMMPSSATTSAGR
jgi:hypothetical protein